MVAGLGGRPITEALAARRCSPTCGGPARAGLHFLDLDRELVERELERPRERAAPGPHAENMLRDLGVVAARSH